MRCRNVASRRFGCIVRNTASACRIRDRSRSSCLRNADAVLRTMQPKRRLATLRQRIDALRDRPRVALLRRMRHDAMHLRGIARSLEAVSPLATVARGYAILQHDDGRVIRSVQDARAGDRVSARLGDGRLPLRVIEPEE